MAMTIQLGRAGRRARGVIANTVATMFNYVISKHTSGLHCKQGMLLVNIQVVYTVNKVCH